MDISKLKLLIESVKLKSFSKVAEKYSYTPSALSHIVDSIENELSLKILQRDYSGVRLTKEGERVFPLLQELVDKSKEIKTFSKSLSGKQNKISIGCYSSVSNNLLPELLFDFKKNYPEIGVNIIVGDNISEMREKKAEIFLVEKAECRDGEFLPVYSDKYVVVVKDSWFSGKKSINNADLDKYDGYPFIMPNNNVVKERFSDLSCEIVDIDSADDSSILSMIKKGLGLSVLPELSVKRSGKGIKSIKLLPEIKRELGVVVGVDNKNPAVKKFIKFISK